MFGIISEVKVVSNEWIKVNQITQSNKLSKNNSKLDSTNG